MTPLWQKTETYSINMPIKAFGNDEELSPNEETDKFGRYTFSMEKL